MSTYDDYRRAPGPARLAVITSANCAPCRQLKPVLAGICSARGIQLEYFDAAQEKATAQRLGLRAVPAVLLVTEFGDRVLFTGLLSETNILRKLAEAEVIPE